MNKKFLQMMLAIICLILAFVIPFFGIRLIHGSGSTEQKTERDRSFLWERVDAKKGREAEERAVYINNKDDMALYEKYKEYNEDFVGIIRIEDTILNHPMVHTPDDEEYYLYRNLDKKYNSHGVPFLDADSFMERQGANLIIYGHNIYKISKDVFAPLMDYKDVEFYKEHPVIETVSESGTRRWLIFAYFITDNSDSVPFKYSEMNKFKSLKEMDAYLSEVEKRNWLNVDVEISIDDTFMTLSSCSRELAGSGTNRMVVMAKQLYVDEDYKGIVEAATQVKEPLLPEKLRPQEKDKNTAAAEDKLHKEDLRTQDEKIQNISGNELNGMQNDAEGRPDEQ